MKKFIALLISLVAGLSLGFFAFAPIENILNNTTQFVEKITDKLSNNKNVTKNSLTVTEKDDFVGESADVLDTDTINSQKSEVEEITLEKQNEPEKKLTVENSAVPVENIKAEPKVLKDTVHGNHGVAAVVNGEDISVDEIYATYEANPQIKNKVSFEKFYEQAIKAYVDGRSMYMAAVKANVLDTPEFKSQVELMKQDIARKVFIEKTIAESVTDDAVKKMYEEYKNSFVTAKEVKAKHILVSTNEIAQEVLSKLAEGKSFMELADKYSQEPADLGYFTKDMMIPEFGEAAFATKLGDYTKTPVKTQYGYHIILIEDIRDTTPESYDEFSSRSKQLLTNKVIDTLYQNISKDTKIVIYGYNGEILPAEGNIK